MCNRPGLGYCSVKRAGDVVCAAALLVAVAPVMLGVGIGVALSLGGPILFRQSRPGIHGHVFTLLKFRSMRAPDEGRGLVSDDQRLTPFGRVLRSTSLDELPGLINVLRGDMSFVGPRPLLVKYLPLYTPEQARRHAVRPGMTGLAQVRGRNAAGWEERLAWDVEYVDSHSLRNDLVIVARTFWVVLSRAGVSAPGEATVTEFRPTR